jgi:hypothetical protein
MEKTSYIPNSVVLLLELDIHAWEKKNAKKRVKTVEENRIYKQP